jgi:hypothetical protein
MKKSLPTAWFRLRVFAMVSAIHGIVRKFRKWCEEILSAVNDRHVSGEELQFPVLAGEHFTVGKLDHSLAVYRKKAGEKDFVGFRLGFMSVPSCASSVHTYSSSHRAHPARYAGGAGCHPTLSRGILSPVGACPSRRSRSLGRRYYPLRLLLFPEPGGLNLQAARSRIESSLTRVTRLPRSPTYSALSGVRRARFPIHRLPAITLAIDSENESSGARPNFTVS